MSGAEVPGTAPWMKFYPSDWQADQRLGQCGAGARGVWIELIAIMHKSETYGHLLIFGAVPTDAEIARHARLPIKVIRAGIVELERWGVLSRTETGVIYSRRMKRDAEKRERFTEFGKKGGNPDLLNKNNEPPPNGVKQRGNGRVNPTPTVGLTLKDKAQSPEARVQKESAATPAPRPREEVPRPIPETPLAVSSPEPAAEPLPGACKPVPRDIRVMPRRSDPEHLWLALGDGHEVEADQATGRPVRRTCRNGWQLLVLAELVCQAALIHDERWRGDWWTLTTWLDEGIDPHAVILPTIKRCAARAKGGAIGRLSYFDKAVREAAGLPAERAA